MLSKVQPWQGKLRQINPDRTTKSVNLSLGLIYPDQGRIRVKLSHKRICRCLLWCNHHHCACDVSTFDLMADNARMIILDTKFGNYRWFGNFWLGICFCWRTGRKPLLSNWHHALAYMWPVTCYNLLQNAFAGLFHMWQRRYGEKIFWVGAQDK